MIVRSFCNCCFQAYELMIQQSDLHLMKEIADETGHTAKCPRLCGGHINLVGSSEIESMMEGRRLQTPMRITGTQLYQAINGLGLPDEIPLNKDVVEMLLNTQIESFEIDTSSGVIYLSELRFAGGRVLHLTSGPRGAQVLKITKARTTVTP